jgi:hypothetical protein
MFSSWAGRYVLLIDVDMSLDLGFDIFFLMFFFFLRPAHDDQRAA